MSSSISKWDTANLIQLADTMVSWLSLAQVQGSSVSINYRDGAMASKLAQTLRIEMQSRGIDPLEIESNLTYKCPAGDSIDQYIEPENIKLSTLWRAVSYFKNTTNASAALRLGLINLLELIWGIEDHKARQ